MNPSLAFRRLSFFVFVAVIPLNGSETREPADSLTGPPFVTATAWGVFDKTTGEALWNENLDTQRSVASTTKIMTALVVLREIEKSPALLEATVTFSERAGETRGSGARIEPGESLSVRDLLYGLMLPSGNDASVALAESFGRRFLDREAFATPAGNGNGEGERPSLDQRAYDAFIARMNETAAEIGMSGTSFTNPHGLDNEGHLSTVADLAKLSLEAFKNPLFREIVNTRGYRAEITTAEGEIREAQWNNTNQLLRTDGFYGVKTGTTRGAGACLVSVGERGDDRLLMVVLGSASSAARYSDSQNLYRYAWLELGHLPEQ